MSVRRQLPCIVRHLETLQTATPFLPAGSAQAAEKVKVSDHQVEVCEVLKSMGYETVLEAKTPDSMFSVDICATEVQEAAAELAGAITKASADDDATAKGQGNLKVPNSQRKGTSRRRRSRKSDASAGADSSAFSNGDGAASSIEHCEQDVSTTAVDVERSKDSHLSSGSGGDEAAPASSGRSFMIEYDGVYHFARNPPYIQTGDTVLRQYCLAGLGVDIVTVPWFDWSQLKTKSQQAAYLRKKLQVAAS